MRKQTKKSNKYVGSDFLDELSSSRKPVKIIDDYSADSNCYWTLKCTGIDGTDEYVSADCQWDPDAEIFTDLQADAIRFSAKSRAVAFGRIFFAETRVVKVNYRD